jgi:hypothetical protein
MEGDKIQNRMSNPLTLMSKLKSQMEYDPMSESVSSSAWQYAGD